MPPVPRSSSESCHSEDPSDPPFAVSIELGSQTYSLAKRVRTANVVDVATKDDPRYRLRLSASVGNQGDAKIVAGSQEFESLLDEMFAADPTLELLPWFASTSEPSSKPSGRMSPQTAADRYQVFSEGPTALSVSFHVKTQFSYTEWCDEVLPEFLADTKLTLTLLSSVDDVAPTTSKDHDASRVVLRRFYDRYIRDMSTTATLFLAVPFWYCMGVVSVSTSKLLLMESSSSSSSSHAWTRMIGNVPPLFLTLQQLVLGDCLLWLLLYFQAFGAQGVLPWPTSFSASGKPSRPSASSPSSSQEASIKSRFWETPRALLTLAGFFFSVGFLTTNLCFQQSSAAFVETIKAAEPLTSAAVAVLWGLETLGAVEMTSLGAIVMGCLLSTLGRSSSSAASLAESFQSCMLVMLTNLCFSFRGLHQKLFRATPQGKATVVDDVNLQFRMQQVGVAVLIIPVLIWDLPGIIPRIWAISIEDGLIASGVLGRYVLLALSNGIAFASYNLASSFVLSRISVVNHASLNCIRRVFAIVVTSIAFGVPITWIGVLGIAVSIGGFFSFTHYRSQKRSKKQQRPLLPHTDSRQ